MLTANAPETKDNDLTWADFQQRNISELVAILGNFVNRALGLTHKYFGGVVPAAAPADAENALMAEVRDLKAQISEALDTFHFREALQLALDVARARNRYLQSTEPSKLAKTDTERPAHLPNTPLQPSPYLYLLI